MKKELIYIGSVNKAMKARQILKINGIDSKIERGMKNSIDGCGYSVLVVEADGNHAKEILGKNGFLK